MVELYCPCSASYIVVGVGTLCFAYVLEQPRAVGVALQRELVPGRPSPVTAALALVPVQCQSSCVVHLLEFCGSVSGHIAVDLQLWQWLKLGGLEEFA